MNLYKLNPIGKISLPVLTVVLIIFSCTKEDPDRGPLRVDTWMVSTFAGSGKAGSTDGSGISADFNNPIGITIDKAGNLYVADAGNHKIRKITPDREVTTVAGSGKAGFAPGAGIAAEFNNPTGIAIDSTGGSLFVSDRGNNRIRRIMLAANNTVSYFAGSGKAGSSNGSGTLADFNRPTGIAIDKAGNIFVADVNNNKIRAITPGAVVATLTTSGTSLKNPTGIILDAAAANLYVADSGNNKILKIVRLTNAVSIVAGGDAGLSDGSGNSAQFNKPTGIFIDGSDLYVADYGNHRIRKIAQQEVTTFAGRGLSGRLEVDALYATIKRPGSVVKDNLGNFYVTDAGNHRVVKIAFVKRR